MSYEFKGYTQKYAPDSLPAGYFQRSQNVERKTKGECGVRLGLADTGITDSASVKCGCIYFLDKLGNQHFMYVEGSGLAGTLEHTAATNPVWTD